MTHDLLTSNEAAAYVRLSPKTLAHRRCRREGPPYLKAGHKILYRKTDLDQWLVVPVSQNSAAQNAQAEEKRCSI